MADKLATRMAPEACRAKNPMRSVLPCGSCLLIADEDFERLPPAKPLPFPLSDVPISQWSLYLSILAKHTRSVDSLHEGSSHEHIMAKYGQDYQNQMDIKVARWIDPEAYHREVRLHDFAYFFLPSCRRYRFGAVTTGKTSFTHSLRRAHHLVATLLATKHTRFL
jgi:hypothetical protein